LSDLEKTEEDSSQGTMWNFQSAQKNKKVMVMDDSRTMPYELFEFGLLEI
jgi:hypothetical protein